MLIGVTKFFRDREAFEALEREVLPKLLESAADDEPVRAWVAGCSTGEEAYSIAMLLTDEADAQPPGRPVQVFATDIDERGDRRRPRRLLPGGDRRRRAAEPPAQLLLDASRAATASARRCASSVIFAAHNVLRDPPFSRLDLVSCRNLLIYLDRAAQQQVLEMFHFALRPGGYLFLGTSETADAAPRFFTPVDKEHRIYRANPVGRPLRALPAVPTLGRAAAAARRPAAQQPSAARTPTPAEVHRQLLEECAAAERAGRPPSTRSSTLAGAARYLRIAERRAVAQPAAGDPPGAAAGAAHRAVPGAAAARARRRARRCGCRATASDVVRADDRCGRCATTPGRASCCWWCSRRRRPRIRRRPPLPATDDPVIAELESELLRRNEQLRGDDRAVRDLDRGAEGLERGAAGDQRGAALGDRGARDQQGGAAVDQRGADHRQPRAEDQGRRDDARSTTTCRT